MFEYVDVVYILQSTMHTWCKIFERTGATVVGELFTTPVDPWWLEALIPSLSESLDWSCNWFVGLGR